VTSEISLKVSYYQIITRQPTEPLNRKLISDDIRADQLSYVNVEYWQAFKPHNIITITFSASTSLIVTKPACRRRRFWPHTT